MILKLIERANRCEMMNELTESAGDVRVTEDEMDDQNEVFCV